MMGLSRGRGWRGFLVLALFVCGEMLAEEGSSVESPTLLGLLNEALELVSAKTIENTGSLDHSWPDVDQGPHEMLSLEVAKEVNSVLPGSPLSSFHEILEHRVLITENGESVEGDLTQAMAMLVLLDDLESELAIFADGVFEEFSRDIVLVVPEVVPDQIVVGLDVQELIDVPGPEPEGIGPELEATIFSKVTDHQTVDVNLSHEPEVVRDIRPVSVNMDGLSAKEQVGLGAEEDSKFLRSFFNLPDQSVLLRGREPTELPILDEKLHPKMGVSCFFGATLVDGSTIGSHYDSESAVTARLSFVAEHVSLVRVCVVNERPRLFEMNTGQDRWEAFLQSRGPLRTNLHTWYAGTFRRLEKMIKINMLT